MIRKTANSISNTVNFAAPGNYRVEVQGHLRPDWSDRFGAMRVVSPPPEADSAVTVLQGHVSDQAELAGILNTLYELHLPLLSVQYLGNEPSSPDVTNTIKSL